MGCKLSNIDTIDQFNIVSEQRKPIVVRDFKADLHQMIQQDEMHAVQNDMAFLPVVSSISNFNEISSPDRKSQLKTLQLIVNQIQPQPQAQPHTKLSAYGKKKSQKITMDDLEQAF